MIKQVTYYDIICDRCGKSLSNESNTCYHDTDTAEITAIFRDWLAIGCKHYCPDCYEYDDKIGNYKSKERRQSMRKTKYCGECEKFLYEDTDGYGICEKTNEECRCSDKCHLTHGKP